MSQSPRNIRLGRISLHSLPVQAGLAPFLFCTVCGLASAATLCVNTGGTGGCSSTISAAVAAAGPRDVIEVGPGVYKEQVIITKMLSLVAKDGRTRNPPNTSTPPAFSNGIFVNGMAAAPGEGVYYVLISGFNIHNANFEGILVANGSGAITIVHNHVHDNNKALDLSNSPATCPGIPAFETNEGRGLRRGPSSHGHESRHDHLSQ